MSEAEANPDFLPRPIWPAAPPRRAQAAPSLRRASRRRPATALPLASALAFDRLLFDVARANRAGHGKELWGFALTPERREPLPEVVLPNGEPGVQSEVLGLVAYVAERTPPSAPRGSWVLTMRWHDPATASDIPDYDQARAEAQAQRARAEAAERRIVELEERFRRLRDER